jgi:hypothetical protein
MAATPTIKRTGLLRHSGWDALFVCLSVAHAAVLITAASVGVIAIGLWWNANTISHNFVHRPFFRRPAANRIFAVWLSLLLGVPQTLWHERHLAHHANASRIPNGRWARAFRLILVESALIVTLWSALAWLDPRFFVTVYVPGYLAGLGLCGLQGHFEHARGVTSHHGRIYNLLFFNDGYHVEHHRRPGEHWTRLPALDGRPARVSRWPAVLRWLEAFNLDALERLVLRSRVLQRFVLARHEQAFRALLPSMPAIARVTIVGGGLFPRTALIVSRLFPAAAITIVDSSARHIETARSFLAMPVTFVHAVYDPAHEQSDLVVIPLAFAGDRRKMYRTPPAPTTLVHDWMWARHTAGVRVSWWLAKRINLVRT